MNLIVVLRLPYIFIYSAARIICPFGKYDQRRLFFFFKKILLSYWYLKKKISKNLTFHLSKRIESADKITLWNKCFFSKTIWEQSDFWMIMWHWRLQ